MTNTKQLAIAGDPIRFGEIDLDREIWEAVSRAAENGSILEPVDFWLKEGQESLARNNRTKACLKFQQVFAFLWQSEIPPNYLRAMPPLQTTGGEALEKCKGEMFYKDIRIRIYWNCPRIGECWQIVLDSEPERRCNKGELLKYLLWIFGQINANEMAEREAA
ncbi:MAG: hypothetical protein AAGA60_09440 [Cyanobacteria bacterium P01_E01_bin.42]